MLLLYGAMPVEIDEALVAFGFGEGVFELQDRIGTDIEYQMRKHLKSEGVWPTGYQSLISDRMVEEGRLGRQSVVGWYRYPGGKGKVEDPLIEDLVAGRVPLCPHHAPSGFSGRERLAAALRNGG